MGLVIASPPALDGVGAVGNFTNKERRRVDDPKLRIAELSVKARRVDQHLVPGHGASLAAPKKT